MWTLAVPRDFVDLQLLDPASTGIDDQTFQLTESIGSEAVPRDSKK